MKRFLSLSLLLVAFFQQVMAQDRTITGKVTDGSTSQGLPGVTVVVKGTQVGTATNADGNYSLTVPASGTTLVFSFIGYTTTERPIGNSNTIDVNLATDVTQLNEVVVTALGVEREKRTLGYAAQNVAPEQILTSREPNIVNALAGKVAGVQINNSGGQAGSSSRIVIRGNTSLTGNNQPLFVVDGIPIDNSTNRGIGEATESALFSGYAGNRGIDIDPNIIENVTVLKGASATALYGSRGAFGVILITTKKGQKQANRKYPRVDISSNVAFDDAITKGYQNKYLQGLNGMYRNGLPLGEGGYAQTPNGATQGTTSWGPHRDSVDQAVIDSIGMPRVFDPRKDFYRTGRVWNNSISLSGGGEKSTYILTYSNLNQQGIVPNNTFTRNSLKANFTSQVSEKFNVSTSVNYINSDNQRMPEGNTKRSYLYSLNFAPISFDNKAAYDEAGNRSWTNETGFNNPFWLTRNSTMPTTVDRIIATNEATLEILPWLKLTNRVGLDTYTENQREHVNIGTISVPNGRMYESLIKRTQVNNDLVLTANKNFGDDWVLNALIGHNINQRKYTNRTMQGFNLGQPGFYDITNTESNKPFQTDSERRLIGLYGSATLDYKNYLFLNLTARNDWSSTLPAGRNSYFYPSVSVGFVFTEVLGLANNTYFPYGKLRVSYAQAGNDAEEYLTNQTYLQANPGDGQRGNILFPYQGVNAFQTNTLLTNNRLIPEIVTEKEIGADLKFLKNRLGVDVSLYDKVSKSQILEQEISSSTGFVSRVINAGEIQNRGIELTVLATPITVKDFTWDIQFNYGKNRYKLKSIAEGVDNIFLGGFESPQIRADRNYGYGVIWGQGFKRNEDGKLVIDDDGLPMLADELGPIGNATPKWAGGLRNTFTYKGLSLSVLFDARKGGDIMNMDLFYSTFYGTAKVTEQRNTTIVYDGVKEDGSPNTTPVLRDQDYFLNWYSSIDENFVEDGSFIKLREVTLSYALPQSLLAKTPFQGLSFSATGRNLWRKTDFSYGDPEGNLLGNTNAQGFYHAVTPSTKGYTFGVNISF
ncbi:SusC/RagA family TonB-linked outer membrane protein [Adhaeribacter swui]|uniref:SusC/RagA family TonB-linked outer membrane protein n=1 Tax=Adhaeribacter swui TaxID=2086471 RepID=A0A7G7G950_9BACT|nr:SusC/RagA family TonB-linked outer membrane protein [Adhaeribacter swui]QNF33684.1 SusC/RagA family TonB-linked outer membrane protein [Adhaeribacter swui]